MNNLETVAEAIHANRHNPRYRTAATLTIGDQQYEVQFAVTRQGSTMAFLQGGLSAISSDAFKAFDYLQRYELQAQKAKVLKEIEIQKKQPINIGVGLGRVLESRLERIEFQLAA